MKGKEITVNVKVFDDPEYCFNYNLSPRGECQWIADLNYCELFDVEDLEVVEKTIRTIKCVECKKAFQEAK